MTSSFCITNWPTGQNEARVIFRSFRQRAAPVGRQTTSHLVELVRWRHRGRSLPSPTASCWCPGVHCCAPQQTFIQEITCTELKLEKAVTWWGEAPKILRTSSPRRRGGRVRGGVTLPTRLGGLGRVVSPQRVPGRSLAKITYSSEWASDYDILYIFWLRSEGLWMNTQ